MPSHLARAGSLLVIVVLAGAGTLAWSGRSAAPLSFQGGCNQHNAY